MRKLIQCLKIKRNLQGNGLVKHLATNESRKESPTNILETYTLQNSENIIVGAPPREKFADVLNISYREGVLITADYPKLKRLTLHDLKQRIKFYQNVGVGLKILVQYPWLLTFDEFQINTKLKIINNLHLKPHESITLLRQKDEAVLKKIVNTLKYEYVNTKLDRVKYMSKQLEVRFAFELFDFIPECFFLL